MTKVYVDSDALLAGANLLRSMGATQVFVFGSAANWPAKEVPGTADGSPDPTPLVRYLIGSGELVRVE